MRLVIPPLDFTDLFLRMNIDSKIRFDMLDFPCAWEIQKTVGSTLSHDPNCSSVEGSNGGMGGPGFLCDCGAITREWFRMKDENGGITDDDLRRYLSANTRKTTEARVRIYRNLRNEGFSNNEAFDAVKQMIHIG